MSKFAHGLLHALALVTQYANIASGAVPAKYQPLIAGMVALAQGVLAVSQHGKS